MNRTRAKALFALAEAAHELIETDPQDQDAFTAAWSRLELANDAYRKIGLGPIEGSGVVAGNAPANSVTAGLSAVRLLTLRWSIIEHLARLQLFAPVLIGATKDELMQVTGRPHQTVSAAIHELRDGGWLVGSGHNRGSNPRRPQEIWKLTAAGYTRYQEITLR